MRTVTMNKKITLQKRTEPYGHSDVEPIVAEAEVCGAVRTPSLTFVNSMAAMGYRIALTVVVWRNEFEKADYTHAVVDGTDYRIADIGAGVNDLFVNLALERQ